MRKEHGAGLVLAALVGCVLLALVPVMTFLVVLRPDSGSCGGQPADSQAVLHGDSGLSAAQLANAQRVIAEGRRRQLPDQAIVIALAVASQESRFTNYANDGRGGDLIWFQAGIARSLRLPHEAVGTDHGSLGIFQQQWPWWGTMRELMTPATAAGKFYDSLTQVSGWESMPVTVAAQRVQRSAYPSAYADDEPLARRLLASAGTMSGVRTAVWGSGTVDCAAATTSGTVTFPLPTGSGYVDQHNWGGQGARWSHGHTGTDLSVACGTPVLAATAGTVLVRTDQAWAGRWLVQVSTGLGRLATWYAHMRQVDVRAGQTVTAGQRLGEVGDLGNATGCHLHFEVHPRGGSIYQDNVDPSSWLRSHVGHAIAGAASVRSVAQRGSGGGFTVATFNTLGASHTTATGKHPGMASGQTRTRGLVRLLDASQCGRRRTAGVPGTPASGVRQARRRDVHRVPPARRHRELHRLAPRPVASSSTAGGSRSRTSTDTRVGCRSSGSADRSTGRVVTVMTVHNPADTRRLCAPTTLASAGPRNRGQNGPGDGSRRGECDRDRRLQRPSQPALRARRTGPPERRGRARRWRRWMPPRSGSRHRLDPRDPRPSAVPAPSRPVAAGACHQRPPFPDRPHQLTTSTRHRRAPRPPPRPCGCRP